MKLNQVIAIEKMVKSKVKGDQTAAYQAAQKSDLFTGHQKVYTPITEDGEKFPSENKQVQVRALDSVRHVSSRIAELLDVASQRDWANCLATADIVVDGKCIVAKAPVPFLLFLEKELQDLSTFLGKLPTLDPAESWKLDEGSGLYRTDSLPSFKTKKVQRALVLFPATMQHPAQTQLITEDQTIGTWSTVKLSGAIPENVRAALVDKVTKLVTAVKQAREEANCQEAPAIRAGQAIMAWLTE